MGFERDFQASLIKELKDRFDGCFVLKTDPTYIQGLPDLLILYKDKWAALECKRNENASRRPNQDHYVNAMNDLSFASYIFPENKEEVLNDLERSFKTKRKARNTKSE